MSAEASSSGTSPRSPTNSSRSASPSLRASNSSVSRSGPVADDQALERSPREHCERVNERLEVFRRLEPANGDEPRRCTLVARARRRDNVDRVPDHDRSLRAAGPCLEAERQLVLGHADGHGGQRAHQAVGPPVERGRGARIRCKRPAVHREDPDGDSGGERGQAPEHSGLRATRVEDVWPFAPYESNELDQAGEIAPRADRSPHVSQRYEASPGPRSGLSQGAFAVGGDRNVEALGQGGEERGHIGLGSADLRERDHDQHPWTPFCVRHCARSVQNVPALSSRSTKAEAG